jgi:hypothetical protein
LEGLRRSLLLEQTIHGKNVLFEAKIVQINLSETILEGVATYKTKLQFSEEAKLVLDAGKK